MKQTKTIMGMPVTVEIVGNKYPEIMEQVFDYFIKVDERFSTYKSQSEISRLNRGEISLSGASEEMKTVFELAEQTKQETRGFFDIKKPDGSLDPSGLVKGWAIHNASKLLEQAGVKEYYVEAGGDIQTAGKTWKIGIKNPFNQKEIIKVVHLRNLGIATSGTYERGNHIYNPHEKGQKIPDIIGLTVVGPNIYEADRFATAAFAMGKEGIMFIENLPGLEGFMVGKDGIGTATSGFEKYAYA